MSYLGHDNALRGTKRKTFDDSTEANSQILITSPHQLRNVLSPQITPFELKQGLRHFKNFLASIHESETGTERSKRLEVLKGYCESQFVLAEENKPAACFSDLMRIWTYAASSNEESLLSLVPSVLAIFLKIASTELELFRDFGLAFCKQLLQKEELRLVNRAFTSTKTKEHIISPCLRLLTEAVTFDGGAVARLIFAKRDITMKRLEVFLVTTKKAPEDGEHQRKPTLRHTAQHYVLANLQCQISSIKEELAGYGNLIRVFLEEIRKDDPAIVIEIIQTLDKNIANDNNLARFAKSKYFSRHNLERLVTLYGYKRGAEEQNEEDMMVVNQLHKFLLDLCTDKSKGVLLPESGWYPSGSTPDAVPPRDPDTVPLGLDSPVYFENYKESVPVRNGNLSSMAQILRPESDQRQRELLLKIFRAAPELIYDFFSKRIMFISDPRPTAGWMNESSFLFSTIQLPVPKSCGWKNSNPLVPPPVFIVIESILPRPLTQKILTRCMNQNVDVVTMYAVRVMTLALRKLQAVLRLFQADEKSEQELWLQASSKLIGEFCQRCPTISDVISLFRKTAKDDINQQEAVLELISAFYEVIPAVAMKEKFDISLHLVDVLRQLIDGNISKDQKANFLSQLQHLLVIALQSTTLRWWQKPDSMDLSAFVSIFKILVEAGDQSALDDIRKLIQSVMIQNSIIADTSSFGALVKSLEDNKTGIAMQLSFLDNCITRLVKKPVLYLEMAQSLTDGKEKLSILVASLVEQWQFVSTSGDISKILGLSQWVSKLFGLLYINGEDGVGLKKALEIILNKTGLEEAQECLKMASKNLKQKRRAAVNEEMLNLRNVASMHVEMETNLREEFTSEFGKLPVEGESHPEFARWDKDDAETAILDGHIVALILDLCSEHQEVRRQGSTALSRFMNKVSESTYTEKQGVYALCGEILETAKTIGFDTPLPYIAGELAARILEVVTNPLHKLYTKINMFLNKGPSWEIGKIPSYWIDKILLQEPERDYAHFEEISWLLGLLIDGLRTIKDLDIYRRAHVFERILSLYNSPNTGTPLRRQIIHLIFRANEVGGSTTLLTRTGILSWIQSQVSVPDTNRNVWRMLAKELYGQSDREWVSMWSEDALSRTVEQIVA